MRKAFGIWTENWFGEGLYDCSKCRATFDLEYCGSKVNEFRFCPNCGTKMDGQKTIDKHGKIKYIERETIE